MSNHFHDWGGYLDRIHKKMARNPKLAAEYEDIMAEIKHHEEMAETLYPKQIGQPRENFDAWYEYHQEHIAPLRSKSNIIWNQLMCKHTRHHLEGSGMHLVDGVPEDDIRDICYDCGADISLYIRPCRVRKSDRLPV